VAIRTDLDDGGDASMLLHLGARARAEDLSVLRTRTAEKPPCSSLDQAKLKTDPTGIRPYEKIMGVTKKPPPVCTACTRCTIAGELKFPGSMHYSGDQGLVRLPVRLPRVAGRRHQARHRRDGRRQDRVRLRIR
jgi:hypothetical protein